MRRLLSRKDYDKLIEESFREVRPKYDEEVKKKIAAAARQLRLKKEALGEIPPAKPRPITRPRRSREHPVYMSTRQVAKLLKMTPANVSYLASQGKIPYELVDTVRIFRRDVIGTWMKEWISSKKSRKKD
ncbi:MAG: hypothetical protein QXO25_04435 [Candidatus Bathyarchaeia archaeon]